MPGHVTVFIRTCHSAGQLQERQGKARQATCFRIRAKCSRKYGGCRRERCRTRTRTPYVAQSASHSYCAAGLTPALKSLANTSTASAPALCPSRSRASCMTLHVLELAGQTRSAFGTSVEYRCRPLPIVYLSRCACSGRLLSA